MHIIVTGAKGFVGRGLVPLLAAHGHTGVATGRVAPADLPAGWIGVARDRVLSGATDTTHADAIMHLEVKQHVPRPTPADIDDFEQVNVGGTREWLEWAARHGVHRFVFTSSIKAVAPSPQPQFESAPLDPDTPYGGSKARAERLVREWAKDDAARAAMILRPAPVYGPGNEANLAAFVRQIRAGKPCLIGTGATRKSIVSRANLAAALEFAGREARPGTEVFNVSDRETPSLAELAAMIATLAGAPPPRRVPALVARLLAPVGDLVSLVTRRDFPLTTARLRAMEETSVFPCDKLVAAGFRHPQTTREGLAEML
ncbi:MAG: NAD(P)-dependent oxidoreductase, partial [Planctomycetia bacterium]